MKEVLDSGLTEVGGEPRLDLLFTRPFVDACALGAEDEQCRTHRLHVARLDLVKEQAW